MQYQQGYVLAFSLMLILFASLVVISSTQRTGTEQRIAASEVPRASLEAAAEAGIHRFSQAVRQLGEQGAGFTNKSDYCEAVEIAIQNNNPQFGFIDQSESFYQEGQIYWVVRKTDIDFFCDCPVNENEDCQIKVEPTSRAFAGSSWEEARSRLEMTAVIDFKTRGNGGGINPVNEFFDGFFGGFRSGLSWSGDLSCQTPGNNQSARIGENKVPCSNYTGNQNIVVSQSDFSPAFDGIKNTLATVRPSNIRAYIESEIASGSKSISFYIDGNSTISNLDFSGSAYEGVSITVFSEGALTVGKSVKGIRIVHGGNRVDLNGGGDNSFSGVIYAPFATVSVSNGGRQTKASILSQDIYLASGTAITEFIDPLIFNGGDSYIEPKTSIQFNY